MLTYQFAHSSVFGPLVDLLLAASVAVWVLNRDYHVCTAHKFS